MENRLNALWVGSELGFLERLSILTALQLGHAYTLYSYTPDAVSNAPAGTNIRDAREIISDRWFMRYLDLGLHTLGSNCFRYALLAKDLGYWVDLDLIFIRTFDFQQYYVFGSQGWPLEGRYAVINGAVLRLPAGSPMLKELCKVGRPNWRPPFYGPRRTAKFYLKRLAKGVVNPEDLDKGSLGPYAITHFAKKTGVNKLALPSSVFYPLPFPHANLIFEPADFVERLISPDTYTVHLWSSLLSRSLVEAPPRGSYLRTVAERSGI